jgi:hypothetical protein
VDDRIEKNLRTLLYQSLAEIDRLKSELIDLKYRSAHMESALMLISTPRRPDGSWNRDRESCRKLAQQVLTANLRE